MQGPSSELSKLLENKHRFDQANPAISVHVGIFFDLVVCGQITAELKGQQGIDEAPVNVAVGIVANHGNIIRGVLHIACSVDLSIAFYAQAGQVSML